MIICAPGKHRPAFAPLLIGTAGLLALLAAAATHAAAGINPADAASDASPSSSNSSDDALALRDHKLKSIAVSPLTFAAAPGATQQLVVTGTYRGGKERTLNPSDETFTSSNPAIATVSAQGVVAVAAGALVGGTATIGVTDKKTGISARRATVVTATTPSPNSVVAATETAENNPLCSINALTAFYWEIGDQNGPLASGSIGTTSTGPIVASTSLEIDSASKLLYAAYVVQERGAADNLSASDIAFLHFTSGYTNMPENVSTSVCPPTLSPDDINQCLTLTNASGASYGAQNPATIDHFDYNSGHMENHASRLMGIGNIGVRSLGATIAAPLGTDVAFSYTEPLMAGGVTTTAAMYAQVLRNILNVDHPLAMNDALGMSPVCTLPSSSCNAIYTPYIQEAWDYSIGHWIEDNPATNGDGAFNSAGAGGFYPWIDATKSYYGILSRDVQSSSYPSVQCGRLIRRAFITGIEQTGTIPTD
jgi:hypothetical protein